METVLFPFRRTTTRASRQVCQESARGFIDVSFSGMSRNLRKRRRRYLRTHTGNRLHAELGGPADQLDLGVDAELSVDGRQVAVDRALADEEALGDLGGRLGPPGPPRGLSVP